MKKLAILLTLTLGGCAFASDPGTGEKIGQVIKLSHQGIIIPTWEAQLIRGGMSNGSGAFGVKPFDFTVSDELVPDVQRAIEAQTEVLIHYYRPFIYSLFASDSRGYYLVSIKAAR